MSLICQCVPIILTWMPYIYPCLPTILACYAPHLSTSRSNKWLRFSYFCYPIRPCCPFRLLHLYVSFQEIKPRSFRVAAKFNVSGSFFKTKFTNLVCTAHITNSTHFSKHTFALLLSSPRVVSFIPFSFVYSHRKHQTWKCHWNATWVLLFPSLMT